MTTLTKAAQDAAEESKLFIFKETKYALHQTQVDVIKEIILRHLTPVQAELVAKDKLLKEAREIIEGHIMLGCDCSTCEEAQDWLARVNPGDQPKDSYDRR